MKITIDVEIAMRRDITLALDSYGAMVQNFQLLDINFPAAFTSAISNTEVKITFSNLKIQNTLLQYTTLQNQFQKTLNNLQANQAKAVTAAPSLLNQALANAATIKANAQSTAYETQINIAAITSALSSLQSELSMSPRELITYQYISSLEKLNTNQNITFNLGLPKIIKCLTEDPTSCT